MAQVVFVAESHTGDAGNGSTSFVVDKPAGVIDGDLMIAVYSRSATTGTSTPPAGWTLLDELNDVGGELRVYYKTASSEGATYTFSHSSLGSSDSCLISITAWRNAKTGAPTYAKNYDSASNTTATGAAITTLAAPGGFLIAAFSSPQNTSFSAYTVANNNPSWNEDHDVAITQNVNYTTLAVAHGGYDFAQNTGAFTATMAGSGTSKAFLIGIIPAGHAVALPVMPIIVSPKIPTGDLAVALPVAAIKVMGLVPTTSTDDAQWVPTPKPSTTWTPTPKP